MKINPLKQSIKIWQQYAQEVTPEELKLELEVHKNLLRFFQIGDYFYYVFNISTMGFDLVSDSIKHVLGYEPSEITLEFFFNKFHPEDQIWYTNFENEVGKFLHGLPIEKRKKYKVRMDFRIRRKDGVYKRFIYQNIAIELYENGNIYRAFGLLTDISELKMNGKPMLSFIGIDGEPSYIDVQPGEILIPIEVPITKREKQILLMIVEGKLNKEIAHLLNISLETVKKHRKNMLKKNDCKNSGELIGLALKNGWI